MVNIPDVNYSNPQAFAEGQTISSGVSIPSNNRVLCVVGEGATREVLVSFAEGSGNDGWNTDYSRLTVGADGRHFKTSEYPLVVNRTVLYKNGVTLVGKEEAVSTSTTFSNDYDYRVDPTTGQIELQSAYIVDQGGDDYVAVATNTGNGTIESLTLIDSNAPAETWTVKCTAVRKDIFGVPIDGYAKFVVSGSKSGVILDGYGAPVIWQSDSVLRNNGILRFYIDDGSTPFNVGDTFTIKVASGVLAAGDRLVVEYIATLNINDPVFYTDMDDITKKYGLPSAANTISTGCQLAFTNGAPGVMCVQAAPSIPRRVTYNVIERATGTSLDDLKIPLPLGVVPHVDSEVKFFVENLTTGVSTQIIPNKITFYHPIHTVAPFDFINDADPYSYTVILEDKVLRSNDDGVIVAGVGDTATFSSASIEFDSTDVGKELYVFGSGEGNDGTYTISSVTGGVLSVTGLAPFVSETAVNFRVLDSGETSAYILMTRDLAFTSNQGLSVNVLDDRDADFYDAGWVSAYTALEGYEVDIVCPLPTQTKSAVIQNGLQHCLKMSRTKYRKERVLFTGALSGLLYTHVTGVNAAAVENIGVLEGIQGDDPEEILAGNTEDLTNYSVSDAFGSTFRCVYFYPDQIVVSLMGSNTILDGFYLGPAAGGRLAATGNVALTLTNKTLGGFSILRNRTYNTTIAENITKAGICLVEPVQGGGRVVWFKTTTISGYAEEEEASIVFIRDKIAKDCRLAVRGFIGETEDDSFAGSLHSRILSTLKSFISRKIITDFRDVVVKRDSVDPRQWNIRFRVQPPYPVNWIYIKFDVGIL